MKAKYQHIADVTVSAKKGHSQLTRWAIWQSHPHPSLDRRLDWENAGQIIPSYSNYNPKLVPEYHCRLLRSDFDPETAKDTRRDYAGYSDGYRHEGGQRVWEEPTPGAITFRGHDLGEMGVNFEPMGGGQIYTKIYVRGFGSPSPGESDWVKKNIVPALQAYIDANRESLKAVAIESLKAGVADTLSKAATALEEARVKMEQAIAQL